ncbi:imidazole glycerol phosphate synthase subunit HisH [Pseudoalteromonas rubra]|uniref:Imidazole glycerol phosphate synthase subunit HisH n=1 Tax=Pseudoalteromonas rubra TaxID=43658 RepID=A0A5S3WRH7_9GAMM|nr:imidazole glycerol phosphate synthase subunit HisH [Pseudoalteromonas rubra]TMP31448.1 imidazole glycerol phosphate synthase subunit HisH [Pseudoalteromonas rubra]TMP34533.1 imidazole glycerol phosphate synthase subunit HisH [Pseudoalteromonas rubra]
MIGVIDCGCGNPGSIQNMLRKLGHRSVLVKSESDFDGCSAIVLPGVGAYDNVCQKVQSSGLVNRLEHLVLEEKIPFLGICVGMQMLFNESEEGTLSGFGWIPGRVKRFEHALMKEQNLKVPHMGWNIVTPKNANVILNFNEYEELRFYFVHSYHADCPDEYVIGECLYGYKFPCAVQKENIFGAQFHPEKSHKFGMMLFKNFLEYANASN